MHFGTLTNSHTLTHFRLRARSDPKKLKFCSKTTFELKNAFWVQKRNLGCRRSCSSTTATSSTTAYRSAWRSGARSLLPTARASLPAGPARIAIASLPAARLPLRRSRSQPPGQPGQPARPPAQPDQPDFQGPSGKTKSYAQQPFKIGIVGKWSSTKRAAKSQECECKPGLSGISCEFSLAPSPALT